MPHARAAAFGRTPGRLLAALVGLALVAVPQTVSAQWLQAGTGPAAGRATAVQAGTQPPQVTGPAFLTRTYTLTFATSTVAGMPARAYIVRRTLNGAPSTMANTTCDDGTVDERTAVLVPKTGSSQTCTDTLPLTSGTYAWTVTPVYYNWLGDAAVVGSVAV